MSNRDAILKASDELGQEQRRRRITLPDIISASLMFNSSVIRQIMQDSKSGYKAWDSFSMILQREKCVLDAEVEKFVKWALRRLNFHSDGGQGDARSQVTMDRGEWP